MHRLITLLHILSASAFLAPLQRCSLRGLKAANEDLAALKVPQLKALLKERGLKVGEKKQELIDRLEEHAAAEAPKPPPAPTPGSPPATSRTHSSPRPSWTSS